MSEPSLDLLRRFVAIPPSEPRVPTFLEITGRSRDEVVASNILKFYLSPDAEHKLGTFVLECLVVAAGIPFADADFLEVHVSREEETDSLKRLDLLISASGVVIGVENKIFAGIYNDLADYWSLIQNEAEKSQSRPHAILLTVHEPEPNVPLHNFVPVTYERFLDHVLRGLGPKLPSADSRYANYLVDFITTIKSLTRRTEMNSDWLDFVRKHKEELIKFESQIHSFQRELTDRLWQLSNLVTRDTFGPGPTVTGGNQYGAEWWAERLARVLYYNIEVRPGLRIGIDVVLDVDGWAFDIFWRPGQGDRPHLAQFLNERGIVSYQSPTYPGRQRYNRSFPYDEEVEEVAEALEGLITKIRAPV